MNYFQVYSIIGLVGTIIAIIALILVLLKKSDKDVIQTQTPATPAVISEISRFGFINYTGANIGQIVDDTSLSFSNVTGPISVYLSNVVFPTEFTTFLVEVSGIYEVTVTLPVVVGDALLVNAVTASLFVEIENGVQALAYSTDTIHSHPGATQLEYFLHLHTTVFLETGASFFVVVTDSGSGAIWGAVEKQHINIDVVGIEEFILK